MSKSTEVKNFKHVTCNTCITILDSYIKINAFLSKISFKTSLRKTRLSVYSLFDEFLIELFLCKNIFRTFVYFDL